MFENRSDVRLVKDFVASDDPIFCKYYLLLHMNVFLFKGNWVCKILEFTILMQITKGIIYAHTANNYDLCDHQTLYKTYNLVLKCYLDSRPNTLY